MRLKLKTHERNERESQVNSFPFISTLYLSKKKKVEMLKIAIIPVNMQILNDNFDPNAVEPFIFDIKLSNWIIFNLKIRFKQQQKVNVVKIKY